MIGHTMKHSIARVACGRPGITGFWVFRLTGLARANSVPVTPLAQTDGAYLQRVRDKWVVLSLHFTPPLSGHQQRTSYTLKGRKSEGSCHNDLGGRRGLWTTANSNIHEQIPLRSVTCPILKHSAEDFNAEVGWKANGPQHYAV